MSKLSFDAMFGLNLGKFFSAKCFKVGFFLPEVTRSILLRQYQKVFGRIE